MTIAGEGSAAYPRSVPDTLPEGCVCALNVTIATSGYSCFYF